MAAVATGVEQIYFSCRKLNLGRSCALGPLNSFIDKKASEYAVFVTAGNDSDTTVYDIATYNTLLDTPVPGGGGLLTATMPTSSTAAVSINTSEVRVSINSSEARVSTNTRIVSTNTTVVSTNTC